MVKVFILGLDGLEYNFVHQWNLPNLLQKQNGKIKVPINQTTGVPLSPEVWASFLTGKHVHAEFEKAIKPLGIVFKLLRLLRKHLPLSFEMAKTIRRHTPAQTHEYNKFPPLMETTFLDETNSLKINVPYYNYDNLYWRFSRYFRSGRLTHKEYVNILKRMFKRRKKQVLHGIQKIPKVDVGFAYIHFPDIIHHELFPKPDFIKQHYNDLDYFVFQLKNKLPESTLFIIVSDHGFDLQTESHSLYGFYSANKPLKPKPKDITDFYDLIINSSGN